MQKTNLKFTLLAACAATTLVSPAHADDGALALAAETAGKIVIGEEEDPAEVWECKLAAGFDSRSGNTDKDAWNGKFEAAKTEGLWCIRARADGAWEETETDGEKTETIGNAKVFANVKRRLGGFFLFVDGSVAHDGVAGVKYRIAESAGLGTFLADDDALKISLEFGAAGIEEKLDEKDEFFGLRIAERADWKPAFANGIAFYETAECLFEPSETDHYVANAEVGTNVPLFSDFSLDITYKSTRTGIPAEGKKKTDRAFLLQLAYNF